MQGTRAGDIGEYGVAERRGDREGEQRRRRWSGVNILWKAFKRER